LAVHDHCPPTTLLNMSAHQVFGHHPVFLLPILTSHINISCDHLRWSILATWPTCFHFRLSATGTMSFMLVLFSYFFAAPYSMQYSPFHLTLTSSEHLFLLCQ
jgi:hypothetical protein